MRFMPIMVSCEYRRRARARTVAWLAAYGIEPLLIRTDCQPARPALTRRAGVTAMRTALDHGKDLLWLEDDIHANDRLPDALALAARQEWPSVLCNIPPECQPEEFEAARTSGAPMPMTALPIPNLKTWGGSQAVYFPRATLPPLLASPYVMGDDRRWAFDTAVRETYIEGGMTLLGIFPNPVQHDNEPNALSVTLGQRSRPKRESPSFGWPEA